MVFTQEHDLVYNVKLSSVGPSRVTGSDAVHNPNGIDLAMKLHYLKFVYFFNSQACHGLTTMHIKESLFYWCNDYYITSGRFRRTDDGRPYMKLNDCGIRFVEAQCDKTVDEWLEMKDSSLNKLLVYHLPLGPDLFFSPPVYLQLTKFKCGGMSMGISWAHIIADAFSISATISEWSKFLAGLSSNGPLNIINNQTSDFEDKPMLTKEPLSLKRVDPVDDHWITANNCKMETFSFRITASHVSLLHSKLWGSDQIPVFESLCAILWQCIAKVRQGVEPKVVTICKKGSYDQENGMLRNNQIISSVKADFSIVDSDVRKLALLLVDQAVDERNQIEQVVENDNGVSDYILYGANLTFLNLAEANLYDLEWNGYKPEFVHCTVQGVGDEGAVLVLPWPEDGDQNGELGRVVSVILPELQAIKVIPELKKNGLILENELQ